MPVVSAANRFVSKPNRFLQDIALVLRQNLKRVGVGILSFESEKSIFSENGFAK